MPTYEYKCKKCGYTFEKFQSITAKPLQHCPKCNGEVFRLISKNGSFILKGSGYYSTDNRKSHTLKENKGISGSTKKRENEKPDTVNEQKKTVAPKSEK
jgi:putative FmdB family regulatory protein